LLSITAADLGYEPEALEKSLDRYFKNASDWDAIVLLDEADVYLEQRTTHDLKRNSIVSGKIEHARQLGGVDTRYSLSASPRLLSRHIVSDDESSRPLRRGIHVPYSSVARIREAR